MKLRLLALLPAVCLFAAPAIGQGYECWREASESCGLSKELIGLEIEEGQVKMSFYYPMCPDQGRVIYDETRFDIVGRSGGGLRLRGDVDCSYSEKDADGNEVRRPCSYQQTYELSAGASGGTRQLVESSAGGKALAYTCTAVD